MLGTAELDSLLSEREKLNIDLQKIIDDQTEPWGVKVTTVEIKDVEIPQSMQRAMARQAEAERERRAKIIDAEGEYQAAERLYDAAQIMSQNPPRSSCATSRRCSRWAPNRHHDRLPAADRPDQPARRHTAPRAPGGEPPAPKPVPPRTQPGLTPTDEPAGPPVTPGLGPADPLDEGA